MMCYRLPRMLFLAATPLALIACQDDAPAEGAIPVPSGREVSLIDVVTNAPGPEGATARFRFLVPDLSTNDVETTADDMQALCDGYALPRVEGMVPKPQQVIISLASEAVPFGQPAPEVVQFFEAYRIADGACVWAAF
jgi:hypothetical protein